MALRVPRVLERQASTSRGCFAAGPVVASPPAEFVAPLGKVVVERRLAGMGTRAEHIAVEVSSQLADSDMVGNSHLLEQPEAVHCPIVRKDCGQDLDVRHCEDRMAVDLNKVVEGAEVEAFREIDRC